MKTWVLILLFGIPLFLSAQKWQLSWSDEFGYTGLPDSAKWSYEVGKIRNNEAQYYTYKRSDNARVDNGMLVLEAHKEDYEGAEYTSASLTTAQDRIFLYGRLEVRAKLPTG